MKYGFTIAAVELLNTIPTLWNATLSFMAEAQHLVAEDNLLSFVTGVWNPNVSCMYVRLLLVRHYDALGHCLMVWQRHSGILHQERHDTM